jgi:hypothetical protein
MLFIFYDKLTIATSRKDYEVKEKLLNVIEDPKAFRMRWLFSPPPDKPYEGKI